VDSAVLRAVASETEALLLQPLFEELFPESGPLGTLGADLFARQVAEHLR